MNDLPKEWAFLETAWRYALLLTGCQEGASKVFRETVDEIVRHPHSGADERTRQLFYTSLRRRALKFPAVCELKDRMATLHGIPEPGRSALALLILNALPAQQIARILGMDERSLADALDKTRAMMRSVSTV